MKSIAGNAVFNMFYNALSVIFPLITVSYASRILGASGIGAVASAQNIVTYFTMLAALGIPSYGVRVIAQNKANADRCNKAFTELFLINLLSTILALAIYVVVIISIEKNLEYSELYWLFAVLIVMNIFNIEWLYQGFEEYRYIALRSFLVKSISTILLFILVKYRDDILKYVFVVCLGTVGNYGINAFQLRKKVRFNFQNIDLKCHIKAIITFFCSVIAIELYSLLDVTMLTYFTDSKNVGYYSNAVKIVKTASNTLTALGAVLLPRLSILFLENNKEEIKKIIKNFFDVIILIAIPFFTGLIFVAPHVVSIMFGKEFTPSVAVMQILSMLIVLMPLSGGVFGQILLTSGLEKEYLFSVSGGAVVNAVLNYILIIRFYQNGAALATILSELVVNIFMIIMSRKKIKMQYFSGDFFKVILSTMVMAVGLIGINMLTAGWPDGTVLLVKIGTACMIYGICLIVFKHVLFNDILKKIIKKRFG